ncbi:phosphoribosyl-ATP pyrophosphohydrolase [Rhodoligotrophos appendicifer]|uniref:phosphoribosyl-ATP diphosphatase n=1 Tax=Rhodoligotrophos appendicifer TaxID=987056 RepID=UPI00117F6397|nr:phosphoribosyl-ATP diphosphatase [Rhodoligotrophos appendicifer]
MKVAVENRLEVLARLYQTIQQRRQAMPDGSYTSKLFAQGSTTCAKKLGEEAVELVIAAVSQDKAAVAAEAADLLFHFLALLEITDVSLESVMNELERREGTSGIVEKAQRSNP